MWLLRVWDHIGIYNFMDLNRFVLKLRLNKLHKCGISGPLIWSEMNKNTTAVQGFLKSQGHVCWHVWCIDEHGNIEDVGWELAKREDPRFANVEKEYIMVPPDDVEVDKDLEVEDRWEKYKQDAKGYWKTEPMAHQNFRAKMFREAKVKMGR
jgi:hypothetical protein